MWYCIKIKKFEWVEVHERAYVKTEDPEEEFIFSEMSNLCQKYIAAIKSSGFTPLTDEKEGDNELKDAIQSLCYIYSGKEPPTPIYSPPDNNNNNNNNYNNYNNNNDLLLKLTFASLGVSCGSILLSKCNFLFIYFFSWYTLMQSIHGLI